jgi:hypothetical protein
MHIPASSVIRAPVRGLDGRQRKCLLQPLAPFHRKQIAPLKRSHPAHPRSAPASGGSAPNTRRLSGLASLHMNGAMSLSGTMEWS